MSCCLPWFCFNKVHPTSSPAAASSMLQKKQQTSPSRLTSLPKAVQELIGTWLSSPADLASLAATCKRGAEWADHPLYWKVFLEQDILDQERDLPELKSEWQKITSTPKYLLRTVHAIRLLNLCRHLIGGQKKLESSAIRHLPLIERADQMRIWMQKDVHIKNLQTLSLSGKELMALASEIGLLTQLRFLHLGYNKLTTLPSSIRKLKALKDLDISYNQMKMIPTEIWQLSGLQQLNSTHNCLQELNIPDCTQSSLRQLNVNENALTTLAKIEQLPHLEKLEANENLLEAPFEALASLHQLNALHLSNNRIRHIPSTIITLSNLQTVFLVGNPIEDIAQTVKNLALLRLAGIEERLLA